MDISEIYDLLKADGFSFRTDGRSLDIAPAERLDDQISNIIKVHKLEMINLIKADQRSRCVLQMLDENSQLKRAVIDDCESDPFNVILTIGLRNAGTFEMLVPKEKFDGMAILLVLDSLDFEITH
jgi:hypothetical protein